MNEINMLKPYNYFQDTIYMFHRFTVISNSFVELREVNTIY